MCRCRREVIGRAKPRAREKREYFYHAPRVQQLPTGALRVVRIESRCYWGPRRKTWYDHRGRLVETQIPKILFSFHELAVRLKAERLEAERQQRLREEEERQEQDRQERREAHANLIANLERQAGAWYRARFLRRYVYAARRAVGSDRIEAKFRDQSIDFLDWAAAYIDQLDPLSDSARNPDQLPEPTHYYRSDEETLKKTLLRLFGFDGRAPSMLAHLSNCNGEENADEPTEDFEDE
jgi:hypothetical protein